MNNSTRRWLFTFLAVLTVVAAIDLVTGEADEAGASMSSLPAENATPLTEPGNGAFAAVAEVVRELNARPETDWSRVDLEALRRHLRDMEHFTLHAEVVERTEIPGGLRVTVTGRSPEASRAVRRAVKAHAPMLEGETGWDAAAEADGARTVLTVTSDRGTDAATAQGDVAKIRGLGFIGLMATGAHHRRHHWMIATGRHPHGGD